MSRNNTPCVTVHCLSCCKSQWAETRAAGSLTTCLVIPYDIVLQVSKDVDSGITHYVCIHVASEVTTKAARELDPTSPVALPKLPNGMAETPTARSAAQQLHSSCHHCLGYSLPQPTRIGCHGFKQSSQTAWALRHSTK